MLKSKNCVFNAINKMVLEKVVVKVT